MAAGLPVDARYDPLRAMEGMPIFETLGMRFSGAGEGWAEITIAATPRTHNPYGIVHGGVWLTLADAAMGAALATVVGRELQVITVQSEFRWLRALSGETMRARAEVLRRGRAVSHVSVELCDTGGSPLGRGSGSYVAITPAQ